MPRFLPIFPPWEVPADQQQGRLTRTTRCGRGAAICCSVMPSRRRPHGRSGRAGTRLARPMGRRYLKYPRERYKATYATHERSCGQRPAKDYSLPVPVGVLLPRIHWEHYTLRHSYNPPLFISWTRPVQRTNRRGAGPGRRRLRFVLVRPVSFPSRIGTPAPLSLQSSSAQPRSPSSQTASSAE